MEIKGLAAIVTGGASGLGAATAERLAAAGAKVTIFDLNVELGAAHARALGGHFAKVDVIDEASVVQGLEEAKGLHGKARILVNCAGIGPPAKAIGRNGQALPLKDFARIINVNLIGTFNVASKFAARIHQSELVGMTLPLAREFARYGIRVMTIAPGIFLTPLLMTLPKEAQDSLGTQVPFPSRLGQPSEFGLLVESILANPMLNGEVIRLDGAIRLAPK